MTALFTFGAWANVRITQTDFEKLSAEYGEPLIKEKIEELSDYIKAQPRKAAKYKSHAAVVRCWARREVKAAGKAAVHQHTKMCREFGFCPETHR